VITLLGKIRQADLNRLQIGDRLRIPGNLVKPTQKQVYAAERRSRFLKSFYVYRLAVGTDRPVYDTVVMRDK
jgi:hypothetical protein